MANKGTTLTAGQILYEGDYLQSENGLFFAYLKNGNFYTGSGDPGDVQGLLWQSRTWGPGEKYFVVMQWDGNLCGYGGRPGSGEYWQWGSANFAHNVPNDSSCYAIMQNDGNLCVYDKGGKLWWQANAANRVVDVQEIAKIDYNVAAAQVTHSSPTELFRQKVENTTDVAQTSTIQGSGSVSETSGWSDSLAVKVGVSTTFDAQIPFVGGGKVQVSVDVTNTYTWNGSTTTTKTWGFNTPVSVPPHTTSVVLVAATISKLTVPYTVTGTVILANGRKLPNRRINGVYTGTNSHDLTVTFIPQGADSNVQPTTRAIAAQVVNVMAA
jgi:hypothetical protein